MAVKTIVIGMGSFGHDVAQHLVQRIEADHGGLDRTPWLKFLVYETEQKQSSPLTRKGLVRHLGIGNDTWDRYFRTPAAYDEKIAFSTWADGEIRQVMIAGGAPLHGANNSRPTGRLCFLHEDNHAVFLSDFLAQFHDLDGLSEADASKAIGNNKDGREQRVSFGSVGGEHSIQVFIVGSLTGGTNSGSFIDIGYFLKSVSGVGSRVKVDAYLTIPHSSYAEPVHWGNALAALTELNHYHIGKPYEVKFPNRLNTVRSQTRPFDIVALLQPETGDTKPEAFSPLAHSVAELIHLTSVADSGNWVVNKLVDGLGNYGSERDTKGRPLSYASLGASVVLFPAEHIIEGLAARLAGAAIGSVLQNRVANDNEVLAFASELAISEDSYAHAMVNNEKVQLYLERIGIEAQNAASSALKGNLSARDKHELHIKNNIAQASQSHDQNYAGEFRNPIYEVAAELADARVKKLDAKVAQYCQQPSHGVYYAASLLKQLITISEQRLLDLESPKTDIGIRAQAQSSLDRANSIWRELGAKKGCNPFVRKPKPQEITSRWVKQINDHWQSTLIITSEEFEKENLKRIVERAKSLYDRINSGPNGLAQFLTFVKADLDKVASDRNARGPLVRGLVLFTPNQTIQEEWVRYLKDTKVENTAATTVLNKQNDWFTALLSPHGLSIYDRPRKATADDKDKVIQDARAPFLEVKDERVERRLLVWPNWESELRKAADAGRISIDVNPTDNQFGFPTRPDNIRRPARVYFHAVGGDQVGDAASVNSALKRLGLPVDHTSDPHRILFTEAVSGFSIYSIKGIEEHISHYTPSRRSRSDIVWQRLDGAPLDREERRNIGLILLASAFGIVKPVQGGGLTFRTLATPFDPARDFSLSRNRDLSDAAYILGRDPLALQNLKDQVTDKIAAVGVAGAAMLITPFNAAVDNWNLLIGNKEVDNKQAFTRELDDLRTRPELLKAILGSFSFDLNRVNAIQAIASGESPAAWRCDNCNQFLAPDNGGPVPALPEICPNVQCSQRIRFDTLLGAS